MATDATNPDEPQDDALSEEDLKAVAGALDNVSAGPPGEAGSTNGFGEAL